MFIIRKFFLITAVFCATASSTFASDETSPDHPDADFALVFEEPNDPTPAAEPASRLYPVGEMLVNRETLEGLLVACVGFDAHGTCDRFRFAQFPQASQIQTYHWASPPFRLAARFANQDPARQQQQLRKWIRKKLSAPRLTTLQRITVGMGTVVAIMVTGAVLSMKAPTGEEASRIFDQTRNILIVAIPLAGYMDVVSPLFTGSATALIGARTENLGEMKENFLIRQTKIRDRIFRRIKTRINSATTYQKSKWVVQEAVPHP